MTWRESWADARLKTMKLTHRAVLCLSGGRTLTSFSGMPVIQLGVTGRKSGQRRTTLLTAPIFDDRRVVLVASKGGDDRHPEWYRNLLVNPDVEITVLKTGETRQLRARAASPAEKAELWPQIVTAYTGYAGYQNRTERDIPVVICEPRRPERLLMVTPLTATPPPTGPDVTSMDEAIARMQQIDAVLPATDGLACFNRMYLDVTEQVKAQVTAGFFADAAFLERLDVVFANIYFATVNAVVESPANIPAAWVPLVECRTDPRPYSIQFALAGMNAHINHDLPIALVRTCVDLGTAPGDGSHHDDYQKVDALLDAAEGSIRQSFESAAIRDADERAQAVVNLICNWSIDSARDVAWDTALALWASRDVAPVEDLFMNSLARTVAMASRGLLVSL